MTTEQPSDSAPDEALDEAPPEDEPRQPAAQDASDVAADADRSPAAAPDDGPGEGPDDGPAQASGQGRRRMLVAGVAGAILLTGGVSFAAGRSSRPAPSAAPAEGRDSTVSSTAPGRTSVRAPSTTRTPPTTDPTSTTDPTGTTTSEPTTSVAPRSATTNVYPIAATARSQYPRSHHDYPAADIFTACGSTFVSPVTGRIDEVSRTDAWNSKVDDGATRGGLSVSVVGDDGVRYYGSHLRAIPVTVRAGLRVTAGAALGEVGNTGSARGIACHLHFGISSPCGPGDWARRRGEVWPQRYLDAWRRRGQLSPVTEVARRPC